MTPGQSVIGYVRVSTEEQAASGLGLDAQRDTIQRECERRGWTLLRIEEDVLSGKSTKSREGLNRALDACRSGEAAGVVAAKLDRLTRSVKDFAGILEDATRHGYNVVAIDMGVDLSTPSGEFLASVMAAAAQWERKIIGERTKAALAAKRVREPGWKPGRPSGVDPVVRARIVGDRENGLTLQAIANDLNYCQVPTAQNGALWHPSTIAAVLKGAA